MKRYHRYQMDFNSKAIWLSGICMGLPVFLLAFFYLYLQQIDQVGLGKQILYLWAPIGLSIVYLTLMRIVRWNSPGAFAIVGAAFCLLLMIQLFPGGNVLRIVLGLLGYLIGGGLLIISAMGILPGRMIAPLAFLVILLVRVLCFRNVSGWAWLQEASALSMISGLMFLPIAFRDGKSQNSEKKA